MSAPASDGFDVIVVGAGTAGLPVVVEAVAAGARVLVIERTARPGGTLHVSLAHMSGAGTRRQRRHGIVDDAEAHRADVERINHGTGRADLIALATAHQGETIDWLEANGFVADPACPGILHLHEAYRTPRTYWGLDRGRSVLAVLVPLFEKALESDRAAVAWNTRATDLLRNADGAVCGVRAVEAESGAERVFRAADVVLATGGYGADPERFARWTGGRPLYTAAMETSTGDGIAMAEAIGARVAGADMFLPTCAGIVEEPGGRRVVWDHVPRLTPQDRLPWEIHVGLDGRRFVAEDDVSVDRRERALDALPGLSFWAIFDDAVLAAAPPLLPGWSAEDLERAWREHPSFVAAEGVAGLAAATGLPEAALAETLADYAGALAEGRADRFGRLHRPMPILGPRFRAVLMHGMVLKTPAGLDVGVDLGVRDVAGRRIPGLWAVGEAIGGSTLSGKAFVGGMSVTPALTFGRLLGRRLGLAAAAERATAAHATGEMR